MTEAVACRWLGRRVSIVVAPAAASYTGLLRHVSSRAAFLLEDDERGGAGKMRMVPLASIARIEAAGPQLRP